MRTSNSGQQTLAHGRKRKAFGGRASVAQALAGAQMAVFAKAGIEQRLTRHDVRCSFRTDSERSGVGVKGNLGLPQSSHGTSVPASIGHVATERCQQIACEGEGAGAPAPDFLLPLPLAGEGRGGGVRPEQAVKVFPHPALRADLPRKRER